MFQKNLPEHLGNKMKANRLITVNPLWGNTVGSRPENRIDPVTTDPKGEVRVSGQHAGSSNTDKSMEMSPWFVSGFVDGEGSFLVSFSIRKKLRVGIEARPSFALAQHQRNKEIILGLQNFFGCGGVRFNKHDQTYKYEVRSLDDLLQKVLPHFEHYPLRTSKRTDYEVLCQVCRLMKANQHLSVPGIQQVIDLAYGMNNLGARRYTKRDLLKIVGR